MHLSVVIPTQNRCHLLEMYLCGALEQQKTDFKYEVLVVDYMSIDGTVDLLQDFKRVYPHLRIIRVPGTQGFNLSKARNIGITAADGEVIFTLDADVEVKRKDTFEYWYSKLMAKEDYCILRTVGGGNLFFKKRIWELSGGYPNFFKNHGYEDWAFMLRANAHKGYKWIPDTFNVAMKHNNKWFKTVKPIRNLQTRQVEDVQQRPGYVNVVSNWEDNTQDTIALWEAFQKNPDKFIEEPLPPFKEIL